jgi:hypothetical protein
MRSSLIGGSLLRLRFGEQSAPARNQKVPTCAIVLVDNDRVSTAAIMPTPHRKPIVPSGMLMWINVGTLWECIGSSSSS